MLIDADQRSWGDGPRRVLSLQEPVVTVMTDMMLRVCWLVLFPLFSLVQQLFMNPPQHTRHTEG